MENIICFLTIFVFLLLMIMVKAWRNSMTKASSRNLILPPGPSKLPIIGNLHQLVGSLPHHCLHDLATKYGPIMHLKLGQVSTIVISSPELAKEVMKTHDLIFASRPTILAATILAYNSRDILFCPYGDYWRQMRKISTLELFGTKRVKSFKSVREEVVANLIRSIASSVGVPVNLSRMTLAFSYRNISRTAFGKSDQDDAFATVFRKASSLLDGFNISDLFPSIKILEVISGMRYKLQKVHKEVDKIIEDIIKVHRERKTFENTEEDDFVDVLLNIQDRGELDIPLTTQDIKATILDVFLGGIDTTATTIDWTISEMVKHPMVLTKAQAEVRRVFNGKEKTRETSQQNLKYLNSVIKETLRLHPPGPLLGPREAREEVEIYGYMIPERTRVIVNAWAIGRDSHCWTEPESFYPERFLNSDVDYKGCNFEYIPFGAGRRICPGMQFALSVVELVLANLLYHFDWRIPDGVKPEDLDMSETFGIVTRRRNELCLIPTKYGPQ